MTVVVQFSRSYDSCLVLTQSCDSCGAVLTQCWQFQSWSGSQVAHVSMAIRHTAAIRLPSSSTTDAGKGHTVYVVCNWITNLTEISSTYANNKQAIVVFCAITRFVISEIDLRSFSHIYSMHFKNLQIIYISSTVLTLEIIYAMQL